MALTVPLSEIVEKSSNRLLGKHESWGRVLLGDVATVLNGFAFKSSEFSNSGGVPLIRIRDVGKDRSDTTYLGEYNARYVVEPGELLVGMDGDFNCARWRGPRGLLNQRVCKITLKSDTFLPKFLDYTLPGYLKAINDVTSSVTVKHLSSRSIEEIPLPLPPKEVQECLVAEIEKQFSRLDEAVANLKRVKANLKRYKAAVLKAAVEGKLTEDWRKQHPNVEPAGKFLESILAERRAKWSGRGKYKELNTPDTTNLPKLPGIWAWVTWDSVLAIGEGAFKRGPFGSALKKSIFVSHGYKVYEQYCPINDDCSFERYYITREKFEELRSFEVKAGDFLISCSGVTLGRITQVPHDFKKGIINQALLRVRLNNKIIDDGYFARLFRSLLFQRWIFDNSTGSAIPNVKGVKELKAIPIPLPPLVEQQQIVAELERRLSVIEELEAAIEANLTRADRLRRSILQRALTGRMVSSAGVR